MVVKKDVRKLLSTKEKKEADKIVIERKSTKVVWGRTLSSPSYSKINTFLKVFSRGPLGLHDLISIFFKIDLSDYVYLRCLKSESVHVKVRSNVSFEKNLVETACRSFLNLFDLSAIVEVDLLKRIPVGSGLGGGSSNVAVTLALLSRYFLGEEEYSESLYSSLRQLAFEIGSDVPFFMEPYSRAVVSDYGRRITPLPSNYAPNYRFYVLACPLISCSTQQIYENFSKKNGFSLGKGHVFSCYDNGPMIPYGYNCLESVVLEFCSDLLRFKKLLNQLDPEAFFALTGSGSSFYALFDSEERARFLFEKLVVEGIYSYWGHVL